MLLAKESLMEPIDMHELKARGPQNRLEELRIEIYDKVNALGIGAQGLGGLTTVLDVKIMDYPTHAASLPVAIIPNCAATRHVHFVLDGIGPGAARAAGSRRLAQVTGRRRRRASRESRHADARRRGGVEAGRTLLLSGKMLTGRDAAHKRIADLFATGEPLPPASTSPTASSITSAPSIRSATKWWVPPARRPPRAWTSSPR